MPRKTQANNKTQPHDASVHKYIDSIEHKGRDELNMLACGVGVEHGMSPRPSGALAVAGLESLAGEFGRDDVLVAINSGATLLPVG